MHLTFIVIGLVCNSLGCYSAETDLPAFKDQQPCYQQWVAIKGHSVMYFDTACMAVVVVEPPK